MGRKLEYIPRMPISSVETQIALWEAQGDYEQAEGLRSFFIRYIREDKIAKKRTDYEKVISELVTKDD